MGWCRGEESSGRAVKERARKNILRNSGGWRTESRIVYANIKGGELKPVAHLIIKWSHIQALIMPNIA